MADSTPPSFSLARVGLETRRAKSKQSAKVEKGEAKKNRNSYLGKRRRAID
jgi:hypothetical protein